VRCGECRGFGRLRELGVVAPPPYVGRIVESEFRGGRLTACERSKVVGGAVAVAVRCDGDVLGTVGPAVCRCRVVRPVAQAGRRRAGPLRRTDSEIRM
jgi:hypothetical protein